MLKVAVIGLGVIGTRHLKNLQQMTDVEVVAVCGRDEDKTKTVAEEFGAVACTSYIDMFEQVEMDAVFVCTPPGIRKGPIEEAALRGIACFIEKPPAYDPREAEQIEQIISRTGIIHSVAFMYRYTGAVSKAKSLIEETGVAVPIIRSIHVCGAGLLEATTPRWLYKKELSHGPLFDQAIHLMDATRYIASATSGDISYIQAFGENVQRPKSEEFTVEENFILNILYSAGTVHSHTHSWGVKESQVKIELLSDQYSLTLDLTNLGSRIYGNYRGQTISEHYIDEQMYMEEAKVFLEAVRTNNQSLIRSHYVDAMKSLTAVINANDSVSEQRILTF